MARKVGKAVKRGTDNAAGPVTLAIDIGGTGVKMQALSPEGKPITERLRVPTPEPATTAAILAALDELKVSHPLFDRVSIGFPGVIKQGKTLTAANLDPGWIGFPLAKTLEKRWGKPTRMANDCAVQGYACRSGQRGRAGDHVGHRHGLSVCSPRVSYALVWNWDIIRGAKKPTRSIWASAGC